VDLAMALFVVGYAAVLAALATWGFARRDL
jgi:hypothetical protein